MAVRAVNLPRLPFSESLLESLREVQPVYHPDPQSEGFQKLKDAGIDVRPIQEGTIESGTILILPASGGIEHLNEIAARLLAPGGCPWDREQTHESLKKYLIEEAYELCEAIDQKNRQGMIEELGDVLLQPLMHAEMARIAGDFTLDDVTNGICAKLIRRHPHVYGTTAVESSQDVLQNWDSIKKQEKGTAHASLLDGVPHAMPALMRALEVSKRAARAGFEWEKDSDVWLKVDEERSEYLAALDDGDRNHAESEMGDLLFTIVNVARRSKIDPEQALQAMISRFVDRFRRMEEAATVPLDQLSPEEWDALWNRSKSRERATGNSSLS